MSVRIRLQRHGRKQRPFYHIVVADSRTPRDGRFIEKLGTYNPMTKPATIDLDQEKAFDWLMKGASPSDTARAILKFKGVMYRKHLARGVQKGALTQEKADEMYQAFVAEKEAKIQARVEEAVKEREAFLQAVSGKAAPVKPIEEEAPAVSEEVAPEAGAEESPAAEEAATETAEAKEEAPEAESKEEPKEEVKEEAPKAEEAPEAESKEEPKEEVKEEAPKAEAKEESAEEEKKEEKKAVPAKDGSSEEE